MERRAAGRWMREGLIAGKQTGASVRSTHSKQDGNARLRHVTAAGRNLRWVRRVCWQLGYPSDGGRADLASSSLLSGRLPCGAPGDGRASPLCGKPPTGEPCAGDPHARFGGARGRVLNRLFLPLSLGGGDWATVAYPPSSQNGTQESSTTEPMRAGSNSAASSKSDRIPPVSFAI